MRPKDTLEPTKQDSVVYKIPSECGKVCIGETGRAMRERIKEHDGDIRQFTSGLYLPWCSICFKVFSFKIQKLRRITVYQDSF